MSIQSMTAFAHVQKEIVHEQIPIKIDIQLKSLNSKSCDVSCRMPHMLSTYEFDVIKNIKEKVSRGTVFCNIKVEFTKSNKPVVVDIETAETYHKALSDIQKKFSLDDEIEASDIITLPGVLTPKFKDDELGAILKDHMLSLLEISITKLIDSGKSEGKGIESVFNKYINHIEKQFLFIQKSLNPVLEKKKKAIEEKVQSFCKAIQSNSQETLDVELFRQIEKLDVAEEVQRFESHLKNLRSLLQEKTIQKGRKIDFIGQELSREINTLGVKTNDSHISQSVIEIKIHLEKIREQSHNLV